MSKLVALLIVFSFSLSCTAEMGAGRIARVASSERAIKIYDLGDGSLYRQMEYPDGKYYSTAGILPQLSDYAFGFIGFPGDTLELNGERYNKRMLFLYDYDGNLLHTEEMAATLVFHQEREVVYGLTGAFNTYESNTFLITGLSRYDLQADSHSHYTFYEPTLVHKLNRPGIGIDYSKDELHVLSSPETVLIFDCDNIREPLEIVHNNRWNVSPQGTYQAVGFSIYSGDLLVWKISNPEDVYLQFAQESYWIDDRTLLFDSGWIHTFDIPTKTGSFEKKAIIKLDLHQRKLYSIDGEQFRAGNVVFQEHELNEAME